MKKSKQQRPVVYTGKVGAKMRAKRVATSRVTKKTPFRCHGGPMCGRVLYLTDGFTMQFTLNGQTGRYAGGIWEQS